MIAHIERLERKLAKAYGLRVDRTCRGYVLLLTRRGRPEHSIEVSEQSLFELTRSADLDHRGLSLNNRDSKLEIRVNGKLVDRIHAWELLHMAAMAPSIYA